MVIIMKAQGLMTDHPLVKYKATLFDEFLGSRMARIENRHIVFFCHFINRIHQIEEILLRIDILLTMGGQKNIFSFFQFKLFQNITHLDLFQIIMQNLSHG